MNLPLPVYPNLFESSPNEILSILAIEIYILKIFAAIFRKVVKKRHFSSSWSAQVKFVAMAPESQKEENVLTISFREWCVEDKQKKNPNRDGSVLDLMLIRMSLLQSRTASVLVALTIIWSNGHKRPRKIHGNPHQKSKKLQKVLSLNLKKINLVSTDDRRSDRLNRFYKII